MSHVKLKHKASKPGTISPISLAVITYLVVVYRPLVYCPPFLSFPFYPQTAAPTYHQQNQSWVHAWKLSTLGLGYRSVPSTPLSLITQESYLHASVWQTFGHKKFPL